MPTFTTSIDVNIDFEVFCSCGAHMCNNTDTRNSRLRGTPQAVVSVCKDCVENETQPLRERIDELEQLLNEEREKHP